LLKKRVHQQIFLLLQSLFKKNLKHNQMHHPIYLEEVQIVVVEAVF
jgi:hypothetical protein